MYCGKCGTANADGASFCASCGAKMESGTKTPEGNEGWKLLAKVAGAGIAALLVILLIFGGRGYKTVVKQYVQSYCKGDAEALIDLLPSRVISTNTRELREYADAFDISVKVTDQMMKRELQEQLQEDIEDNAQELEELFGRNPKITVKILDVEKADREALNDLKQTYKEEIGIKPSGAMTVVYQVTVRGDGMEEEQKGEAYLVKVGRSWYLDYQEYSWAKFSLWDAIF